MRPVSKAAAIFLRWAPEPEAIALALLLAALAAGAMLSPHFLDARYLLDQTSLYMETGLMALAMTLLIIGGQIDLSVAANLALTAVISAKLFTSAHVPMGVAMFILAPLIGTGLGLFNGVLVAFLRLPSLVVTLGTLALYRGLAHVLVGDHSISGFPDWFVGVDYRLAFGIVPAPLLIFAAFALAFAILLHRTVFGRNVYALGINEAGAFFSGLAVKPVNLSLFAISGFMSGIGAVIMLSRLSVARYDLASGDELTVITAVVLGGTDIFGGRGTIFGTVIALFLLGILRSGMGLADVSAEKQLAITGTLLIASVLLSRFGRWLGHVIRGGVKHA